METPFVYGRLATGKNFTNRDQELKRLKNNFVSGTNTVLISPRRLGKSSLVARAAMEINRKKPDIRIVFLDMYNVRTEADFYRELLEKAMKAVAGKLDELVSDLRSFLMQWAPTISFSIGSGTEISLTLNWEEAKKQPDQILNFAENLAREKGFKMVIAIDEFQNIHYFNDALAFQKKLRSNWQRHQHVSYCLYGSKRSMLMEVFASPSMPFYKFGDLILLERIHGKYWKSFIEERFSATGKSIGADQAGIIAELVENHPYYVQQLAQLVWLRTDKSVADGDIYEAHESLILQLSLLFHNLAGTLTSTQINYLKAMLKGEKQLSSQRVINEYRLGTSANVARLKKTLTDLEIIERKEGGLIVSDPLFSAWLRRYYFKL